MNNTYPDWLSSAKRLLASRRPNVNVKHLDPNECFKAFNAARVPSRLRNPSHPAAGSTERLNEFIEENTAVRRSCSGCVGSRARSSWIFLIEPPANNAVPAKAKPSGTNQEEAQGVAMQFLNDYSKLVWRDSSILTGGKQMSAILIRYFRYT